MTTKAEWRAAEESNRNNLKLQGVITSHAMRRCRILKNVSPEFTKGFWEGHKIAWNELCAREAAINELS